MPTLVPGPARGCVKGLVLQSRLAYLEAQGGKALLTRALAAVTPDHRKVLTQLILQMGWYPFELNEDLDRAIVSAMGGGKATLRRMGAQSAIDSLGHAHKNLKKPEPQGLLKHSAQIHNLYYNTGYRTYEWLSPTSAALRTFECKSFSVDDCQTNLGWHETAIGLCGGNNVRVAKPRCRAQGHPCCEYICSWQ